MSTDELVRLGRHIRRARTDKRWTQKTLATEVGVSVSYVGLVERGKRNPTFQTILNIAKALGVPVESLIT